MSAINIIFSTPTIEMIFNILTPLLKNMRGAGAVNINDLKKTNANELLESFFSIRGVQADLINELSSIKYENRKSNGKIYFTDYEFPRGISKGIEVVDPIHFDIENIRTIRKLLETCHDEYGLIISHECIIGIGIVNEDTFNYYIDINSDNSWIYHEQTVTIKYRDGIYMTGVKDSKDKYWNLLRNMFSEVKDYETQFISLYESAINQSHGTILIISDMAEAEAQRLRECNRGIRIKDKRLSQELIDGLSSIDGAMIFDETAKCMGVGYILDGKAIVKGSNGRGARYNSARNYIAVQKEEGYKFLAVVISEDKMVDIITTNDEFEFSEYYDTEMRLRLNVDTARKSK